MANLEDFLRRKTRFLTVDSTGPWYVPFLFPNRGIFPYV